MRTRPTTGFIPAIALVLVLGACGQGALVAPGGSAESASWPLSDKATIGAAADDGARIVTVDELDERTRDLTVESPSVGTVQVRLFLPDGFDPAGDTVYPALYLLHGADGEYSDWSTKTNAQELTAPTRFLVVMPATASSFVGEGNTQGAGALGRARWEPFLSDELTQLMERNWKASDRRALAGLSLGGYGAVFLAARHPGKYDAVASYSGALDITGAVDTYVKEIDQETKDAIQRIVDQASEIGTYSLVQLAPLLKGTKSVFVSFGNGQPGPLDPADRRLPSPLERWCGGGSALFVEELEKVGVPVTVDAYGDGTHSWEYWNRELGQSLPMLLESVGEPVPDSLAAPASASPAP